VGANLSASDVGRVEICLLGSFRVLKDGRRFGLRPGGRAESLLCALALGPRRSGLARDDLLQMIWPGQDFGLSVQALHTLVYSLRRSFGDALRGAGPVVSTDGRYRLNAEAGVVVDVDRFDEVVDQADRFARTGQVDAAMSGYSDAVDLYDGDLIVGSDVRNVLERERLRARYLTIRARLADNHLGEGDLDSALADALDILAHDPCREDAHRMAMRCYVRLGQRAQALRQYRICQSILLAEFEASPEQATDELYELVRLEPIRV
jgi:DNA-binding SARP family transcriptional activator